MHVYRYYNEYICEDRVLLRQAGHALPAGSDMPFSCFRALGVSAPCIQVAP
jgi:hypothetical protein